MDIDSTPGNNVPGEDDIDDAPVMLTVKTGEDIVMYISIAVGALAIVTAGAIVVKKKVLENN
jgi:LPXTG-motif cell wall-anchored protein